MNSMIQELQMYNNFDELADDVLHLARQIMPGKLIYLTSLGESEQVILKVSDPNSEVLVTEGLVVPIQSSVCNRIDFDNNRPLIYENIQQELDSAALRESVKEKHLASYLGLPISHQNGEKFGTLCVVHHEESTYDEASIQLLQRIVRMFTYYLELERNAYRDTLTELYNRRYLAKYFEKHTSTAGTLFYLDLDGFKKVNDTFGHDAGDEVLVEVARRLEQVTATHPEAFAVRLGGDEFVIHFAEVPNQEEMRHRAEHIIATLSQWGQGYKLSASIGIISYQEGTEAHLQWLLQRADEALYHAKQGGKNSYRIVVKEVSPIS